MDDVKEEQPWAIAHGVAQRAAQGVAQGVAQRVMPRRGQPAAVECPEVFNDPEQATWNRGLLPPISDEDIAVANRLYQKVREDKEPTLVKRVMDAYVQLPASIKHRIWRKEVDGDGIVANYKDQPLAPNTHSTLLPSIMTKQIWTGAFDCKSNCPKPGCPWAGDCLAFEERKTRWDQQIIHSDICHTRWLLHQQAVAHEETAERRAARLLAKKAELRARRAAERELSRTMFHPTAFDEAIIAEMRTSIGMSGAGAFLLQNSITLPSHPLTFLDFQCLIADYFHDGMPGFRITSTKDTKISGIRIYHPEIIRIGKESHHAFIYAFLKNVLDTISNLDPRDQDPRHQDPHDQYSRIQYLRIQDIFAKLMQPSQGPRGQARSLFPLPPIHNMSHGEALEEWRKSIGLEGRIEESISDIIHIPHVNENTYHINLKKVITTDPMVLYTSYLDSKMQYLTIHHNSGDIAALDSTKSVSPELNPSDSDRVLIFLLLVLFGPSYKSHIHSSPALFTFDAHKGHLSRLLAKSHLSYVHRLVTPYNIADSAMTEKFVEPAADDVDEEAEEEVAAEELARMKVSDKDKKAKKEAVVQEEEEEEEEDLHHPGAQRGLSHYATSLSSAGAAGAASAANEDHIRFAFSRADIMPSSSSSAAATVAVVSDTHMIFDYNWLIYYEDVAFSGEHPYQFSMNLVDAGLHNYIKRMNKTYKHIPSSYYTIKAPFSNAITRGPSLNYLMLGLLRGSTSDVFSKKAPFQSDDDLYPRLCDLYPHVTEENYVKKLLPIYTIPASSHSLPLFQHIAKAPLFAYHMLYDLQHHRSALPSRIKWAGDREQYMAVKGVQYGIFVTLDTTAYFCALANGVTSLLERKHSIKLVGAKISPEDERRVKEMARQASVATPTASNPKASKASKVTTAPTPFKSTQQGTFATLTPFKSAQQVPTPKRKKVSENEHHMEVQKSDKESDQPPSKKGLTQKNNKKKGGSNSTRKNLRVFVEESSEEHQQDHVADRDYFFLNWLYPITMSVNAVYYDRHPAEHAVVLLKNLRENRPYPHLFPVLQGQFIRAVSRIPHVPETLLTDAKEITAETYDDVASRCMVHLKTLYTSPSSIFSDPTHVHTLLGYLIEMKQALSARYSSKDSTMDLLHALLTQEDQEKACLVLALLFERLHGRIQSGTSYLGQILGITGGPELKRVDDQEAWEHLTTVMEEDMARIAELASAAPIAVAIAAAEPPVRNISAKLRRVNRGPAFHKLNNALTQLRSNRHASRARAPRATMTQNARRVVMGGSLTRRAKRSRRKV